MLDMKSLFDAPSVIESMSFSPMFFPRAPKSLYASVSSDVVFASSSFLTISAYSAVISAERDIDLLYPLTEPYSVLYSSARARFSDICSAMLSLTSFSPETYDPIAISSASCRRESSL